MNDTIRVFITDPNSPNYNTIVTLDIETQYLPYVVAAENGAAPIESMKVQAIASRTFAYYKKITAPRSLDFDVYDDIRDQVYNPNLDLNAYPNVNQSVLDTQGTILKYKYRSDYNYPVECIPITPFPTVEVVICSFFVSGVGSYAQYVTYNQGKSGECIIQTTLGIITNPPSLNPYNRGCMGQIQSNELATNQFNMVYIIKYFYGDDIIISQINVTPTPSPTPIQTPSPTPSITPTPTPTSTFAPTIPPFPTLPPLTECPNDIIGCVICNIFQRLISKNFQSNYAKISD